MIDWIKKQDPYAVFLWIVLGIPLILTAFAVTGLVGLVMWRDDGWGVIPAMFFASAALPLIMGAVGGGADAMGIRTAKDYCMAWAASIAFIIVVFAIPAIIIASLKTVIA